jgi:hypothetical protein
MAAPVASVAEDLRKLRRGRPGEEVSGVFMENRVGSKTRR